jgi:Gpi18-like mannosyltransferase
MIALIKRLINQYKTQCEIIVAVALWRITLGAIAYLSRHQLGITQPFPWPEHFQQHLTSFARWDSGWYMNIIQYGYLWDPERMSNVAFFPLYPALMKMIGLLLGERFFLAGEIISLISITIGLILLHALVQNEFNKQVAKRAVMYVLLFPMSFFFASVYTESLFFMVAVAACWFARNQRWALAGIMGALATATRFIGIFLVIALVVEYLHQKKWAWRAIKPDIAWITLGFTGILTYTGYLWIKFGNPLIFIQTQDQFQRTFEWPWITMFTYASYLTNLNLITETQYLHWLIDLGFLTFFTIVIIASWKQLRPSYQVFALSGILIPIFSGTLLSTPRYMIALFPLFIALAIVGNHRIINQAMIITFPLLLAYFTILFTNWFWVA